MNFLKTKLRLKKIRDSLTQIPLLSASAVFFVSGILIGSFINIPFFICFIFCLVSIGVCFCFRRNNLIFLIAFLVFCLGIGALHIRNYLRLPDNHIGFSKIQKFKSLQAEGIIESDPAYSQRKVSFVLKLEKILFEGRPQEVKGNVLVNIFTQDKLSYGNELLLTGTLYRPFDFGQEPHFSYRDYLKNQGIYYILSVKKENTVNIISKNKGNFLKAVSLRMKHAFMDTFQTYLWPVHSSVLSAIILGERQNFPEGLRQAFVQTGTAHIIAISGFNVGIVAFIILILLKALRIKRAGRYWITLCILILHMYAVGSSASVVRATVMAIVFFAAALIGRDPHIVNSLSFAALLILGGNPLQIFDIGFQLSFASVLAIVSLSPRIEGFLKARLSTLAKPKAVRFIVNSFSVSLAAWLVTSGFIAYYFRIVSPITILANLIIVPYTSLIIILGFTLGLLAFLCPVFAWATAATINLLCVFLFKITFWLAQLPFAYFYLAR